MPLSLKSGSEPSPETSNTRQ
ncbi:hypothetical protein D6C13_21200 [Rahnella woolbedingensis]|uniref:Uncharacterized protein n=1 Tax=Rahnella woolbedingensis TaxID=1510574 RepID=A0A419N3Y4_9GAMM|nr:hypothetical protein D6C13_21200 [Rahnella woolbedingensis]